LKTISDRIAVKCTAANAFGWFLNLDKNYCDWHKDHISCSISPKGKIAAGTTITSKEYLHGKPHSLKMIITSVKPDDSIEYRTSFPLSMICPGGSFHFQPYDDGILFTATLDFRLGAGLSRLFKRQYTALVDHMREEGMNLKRILETNTGK